MAHFAELDKDNKVIRVVVVPDEFEIGGQKYLADDLGMGGTWIQTSYNAKIRDKFAGIGDIYDAKKDVFYSPKVVILPSKKKIPIVVETIVDETIPK